MALGLIKATATVISYAPQRGCRSPLPGPPQAPEREVARKLFESQPGLLRPGQTILADKGYASKEFETQLNERGVTLVRPATAPGHHRTTTPLLKPLCQLSNRSTPP